MYVCVFVCVCVCLCLTDFFLYFYSIQSAICFAPNQPPSSLLHLPSPPLFYTNASVAPSICQLILVGPSCHRPPSYPIVHADLYLTSSLASRGLGPATALALPSMPHPLDTVSGGCTSPFPWRPGGKGCQISLSLVTSDPLRSHTAPNISASAY